jgi:hypothetical protein
MNLANKQSADTDAKLNEVRVAVADLPDLDFEQRKRVEDICVSYWLKTHLTPGYKNIAHMVRTTKPTPTGHKALPAGWGR